MSDQDDEDDDRDQRAIRVWYADAVLEPREQTIGSQQSRQLEGCRGRRRTKRPSVRR